MQKTRLDSMQALRLFAACLVVLGHAQHELSEEIGGRLGLWGRVPFDTGFGVDIFFVISGFVMYYTMSDRFGKGSSAEFLKRRLIRIVPLYWIFTTLVLAVGLVEGLPYGFPNVLFSYVFLPGPVCGAYCFPVLTLGWSLNYEMMFYAIFAIGLLFGKRAGLAFIAAAIAFLVLVRSIVYPDYAMIRFWGDPIVGEFLLGIALAWIFCRGVRLSFGSGLLLAAAGIAIVTVFRQWELYDHTNRFVFGGIPAALVAAGTILAARPFPDTKPARFLIAGGDASYALYLCHPVVFKVLMPVAVKLGIVEAAPGATLLLLVASAVSASFAVHYLIEKPLLKLLNGRLTRYGSTGFGDGQPVGPRGLAPEREATAKP